LNLEFSTHARGPDIPHPPVRLDCCERIVRNSYMGEGRGAEECALANVGFSYDTHGEAHGKPLRSGDHMRGVIYSSFTGTEMHAF